MTMNDTIMNASKKTQKHLQVTLFLVDHSNCDLVFILLTQVVLQERVSKNQNGDCL
jgi:hypothetical protein